MAAELRVPLQGSCTLLPAECPVISVPTAAPAVPRAPGSIATSTRTAWPRAACVRARHTSSVLVVLRSASCVTGQPGSAECHLNHFWAPGMVPAGGYHVCPGRRDRCRPGSSRQLPEEVAQPLGLVLPLPEAPRSSCLPCLSRQGSPQLLPPFAICAPTAFLRSKVPHFYTFLSSGNRLREVGGGGSQT